MVELEPNSTDCICSDLQHGDYSPIYAWFNWLLIIVCLPSLSVVGVLTNIVNVYVYSRRRMQSSANTYLLFLACSDFLVILTGVFIFWIDSARSYIQELALAPYTTVYTLPFGYMAQTCSIYFTVAAAVDCYINVCWKGFAQGYCSVRRARQILVCVIICSIVYNSLRFPQFNLRKCLHEGSQEFVIEICPTTLFFTVNTIYNVYMYMVLMTLLPFMFLLVLNAFIVVKQSLSSSSNVEVTALPSSPSSSASASTVEASSEPPDASNGGVQTSVALSSGEMSSDDTITMIAVVLLFLCCNTLALVVNIIETFFEPDALLLNMLTDASNFLVIFNSSVNCIIYIIFNTEYRAVFVEDILHGCCKIGKSASEQDLFCKSGAVAASNGTNGNAKEALVVFEPVAGTSCSGAIANEHSPSPIWRRFDSTAHTGDIWTCAFAETAFNDGHGMHPHPRPPSMHFEPSPSDFLLADEVDEGDSGWADENASQRAPQALPRSLTHPVDVKPDGGYQQTASWLAEVKIMESKQADGRPHIYVKPIARYDTGKMSVTAL